ncbi:MAG: AMP-binding protein, partial [Ilumatobacter sp.]|nr:AMP-binding protein [Ilumatobacter sp.]
AARAPDADAIIGVDRSALTYADLVETTDLVASELHDRGVRGDARVALVARNGPGALTGFLGIASGCACAPLNPTYPVAELDFYLRDLGARAVVVDCGLDSPVREVARDLGVEIHEYDTERHRLVGDSAAHRPDPTRPVREPDDVALVLHTSGTTARPKVVPLRHRELSASAANIAGTLDLTPADRCLNVMPLFHIHGLVGASLSSLAAGASIACTPGFHPHRFFTWVEALAPTWYSAVPTMHQAVLAQVRQRPELADRSRFRLIRSSSAALPPAVFAELETVFGAPVIEAYGMTEASHQMASNPLPPRLRKPGSVGPAAGPELAILDERGNLLPAGVIGEAAVRGPTVFSGYQSNPEANSAAFVDGWFRTGDQGLLDGDGYLFLHGRLKEIINRGGEKISPLELDNVLLLHPAVAQAVCFGFPDDRLGEDVAAAVVLRPEHDASEREIQEFVAERVAPFKVPRFVRFVDEIPKGSTGKLRRLGLAELLGIRADEVPARRSAFDAGDDAPRSDLERALAREFCTVLDIDQIGRNDSFFDAGGESILAAELIIRLRQSGLCPPDIPLAALLWAPTPAMLAEWSTTRSADASPILIPMNSPESAPEGAPLHLIHGGAGDVVEFVNLAEQLGRRHPLFCFRARALDEESVRSTDIGALAREYVDALTETAPSQPIHLAGICGSAPIGFEMTRLLREQGLEVAPLVLIDPLPGPWNGQHPIASAIVRSSLFERVHSTLRQGWVYRTRQWLSRLRRGRVLSTIGASLAWRVRRPERTFEPTQTGARRDIRKLITEARRRYVFRPLQGQLVVLHTRQFPTPKRLWARLAPDGLRWVDLPVSHSMMLSSDHPEQTAALADALGDAIGP